MAVMIKSPGVNFLAKVGVSEAIVAQMKAADVKMIVGFKDFSFVSKDNTILAKGMLPVSANVLAMKEVSPDDAAKAKAEVEKVALVALKSLPVQLTATTKEAVVVNEKVQTLSEKIAQPSPKKSSWPKQANISTEEAMKQMISGGSTLKEALAAKAAAAKSAAESISAMKAAQEKEKLLLEQAKAAKWAKKNELWKSNGVIHLKDATDMYQRVHGTNHNSVYVVVALNEKIKVAARIVGSDLSVRIEGEFTDSAKKALKSQGLQDKGKVKDGLGNWDYMSGHYNCGNVPPDRVVGAILIGCGLPFETPIPNMEIVRKHSAG